MCGAALLRERYAKNPEYHRARVSDWYQNNQERAKEASRIYRQKNPEKRVAATRRWRNANPEKVREINRRGSLAYATRYPERVKVNKQRWADDPDNKKARRESVLAWHKANPEKRRVSVRNRRARIKGSPGTHTAADVAALLIAQGHKCANCNGNLKKIQRHLDHIMPIALGGANDKANLQWLCGPCNRKKNAKDPIEFAQSQGRLL
jgi:5-methylcytosine-specific restriction endonuclease McrA